MIRRMALTCLLVLGLAGGAAIAASAPDRKQIPKEDVVDVPAIGQGLCVSNTFQTNMVLQRDKPLNIWGWAQPGEAVTVSFAGQEVQGKAAADRSWTVTLKPMPANSTPQILTVKAAGKTLTLENILVGDVWLLGGQSNMEFPLPNVDDGTLEVVSANFPQIRLLTMPQGKGFDSVRSFERLYAWSDWSKRHFRKGDWDVCSPETVKEFSAIGYVFGRRLFMARRRRRRPRTQSCRTSRPRFNVTIRIDWPWYMRGSPLLNRSWSIANRRRSSTTCGVGRSSGVGRKSGSW